VAISAQENSTASTEGQAETGTEQEGELLRLRSEVTRLSARKRELAAVAEENQRLKAQLENSRTNGQASSLLPACYIHKAQAQFAGYATPENTFQSFLWALRSHDVAVLLQSLTPDAAQKQQGRFQNPSQEAQFFKDIEAMPGLALQNRKDQPDG